MDKDAEIKKIRKILENTHRPMIMFDSDADGLTSFIMVYNFIGDGKGVYIKGNLDVESGYLTAINSYSPDRVIILDKPKVTDEFLSKVKVPILWIDHHPIHPSHGKTDYFNPLLFNKEDNRPTSYWVYKIINNKKNLWIAMAGTVGDWQITDIKKDFIKECPELLDEKVDSPPEALFNSKIGKIARIFDFCMKGTSNKIKTNIKILTRIEDPYELLDEKTAKAKFIVKHYKKINEKYQEILKSINTKDKKLITYFYKDSGLAASGILSNEIQYKNPKKFIVVAREKGTSIFCSIRSQVHNVQALVEKIIPEFKDATGGGHVHACGAHLNAEDYPHLIERIKQEMDDFKI